MARGIKFPAISTCCFSADSLRICLPIVTIVSSVNIFPAPIAESSKIFSNDLEAATNPRALDEAIFPQSTLMSIRLA